MEKYQTKPSKLKEAFSRMSFSGHTHVACISITNTIGSSPRESGCKMLVAADEVFGSIGGGKLEYKIVEMAREALVQKPCKASSEHIRVPLGPSLGQCCGGVVHVLLEITALSQLESDLDALEKDIYPSEFQIVIFGAGHVGKALINILGALPCSITWIDSREDMYPQQIPANVSIRCCEDPEFEVPKLDPQSYCVVMTHSHQLDEKIVFAILKRNDSAYCGLIGSHSKAQRFNKRLTARGLTDKSLQSLTCPIGDPAIQGKHPGEIAFALASQLLQLHQGTRVHQHTALS